MRVEVDNGKAIVNHFGNDFRIEIPSKKNFFILVFTIVWLGGWTVGEIVALTSVISGVVEPFLIFWLLGWSIGGVFVMLVVLWMLFGKEVIYSDRSTLIIEKKVIFFKISREYDIDNVKNLRVIEDNITIFNRKRGLEFFGMTGGIIHFDYGMKTVQFGINLDVAEANHLLSNTLKGLVNAK